MNIIPQDQRDLYKQEGYMILPGVIPPDMLEMLREECSYYLGYYDSIMDAKGVQTEKLSHRGKRYFINNRYRLSNRLWRFLFSDLMAEVAKATVGPDAQLFHEQWVVKGAEQGMKFSWHQDSGYVGHKHTPYVSIWCALDDMSEANGTIYVLPYSRAGVRETVKHTKEEGTNDMIGYHGDDPGVPVIVPAGTIVCFSSNTFHRSGFNTTKKPRRSPAQPSPRGRTPAPVIHGGRGGPIRRPPDMRRARKTCCVKRRAIRRPAQHD